MAKRLAQGGRQKLEKEIHHNVTLLSANTVECEEYITELEALLRQQTSERDSTKVNLEKAEAGLAAAQGRIDAQKDEIQAMRTDAKLAALQQVANDKELNQLKAQLEESLHDGQNFAEELKHKLDAEQKAAAAELQKRDQRERELNQKLAAEEQARSVAATVAAQAHEKALLQAEAQRQQLSDLNSSLQDELDALQLTLTEYRECDKALRERIVVLEQMLSDERKKAGQDLLLRIMELESMLESERNKANNFEELPTVMQVNHTNRNSSPTKTVKTTTVLRNEPKKSKRG